MIKLECIGCLGVDVQRIDNSGNTFYSFNMAVNRRNGNSEETLWVGCTMRNVSDRFRQFLVKGQCVFVRGEPRFRIFDSAKYHTKMVAVDLFVDDIHLVGKSPDSSRAREDDAKPF